MRILLVTDAWEPQTNGVVTTLGNVVRQLRSLGHGVSIIEPGQFPTVPLPSYAEIAVASTPSRIGDMIDAIEPDAVHVATEGPLGLAARGHLVGAGIPFTTSLHTKFPEYVHARIGLPVSVGYRFLRWFHRPAFRTLVTTRSHQLELEARGFERLVVWGRGVDTSRFRPERERKARTRPRLLYVGRVAVEKNIEAFLSLRVDADKVVVGDGPHRADYQRRYPEADWRGYRYGRELAASYADADVFVFPSVTDTFGLVMLEAMACGTPVAAYPVTGPKDVVEDGVNGALDDELERAVERALAVSRHSCRDFGLANDWKAIAERLLATLAVGSPGSGRTGNEALVGNVPFRPSTA